MNARMKLAVGVMSTVDAMHGQKQKIKACQKMNQLLLTSSSPGRYQDRHPNLQDRYDQKTYTRPIFVKVRIVIFKMKAGMHEEKAPHGHGKRKFEVL